VFFRTRKFSVFAHLDLGVTRGPGQLALLLLQVDCQEGLAFELCVPSANKLLQLGLGGGGLNDLNRNSRYSEACHGE